MTTKLGWISPGFASLLNTFAMYSGSNERFIMALLQEVYDHFW
jgi:hypothetical protein